MSSSAGSSSTDADTPRNNFLVFTPPPRIYSHTPISTQQLSATLAPILQSKPVSFAHHVSAAPYPVSDLRPAGIVNQSGVLLGLCLESPSGEVINVVVDSTGFPGNILYRGSYRGINQAAETATLMGYPGTLCWMTNPATSFDMMVANLPPGYRKVDLQIRYIDTAPREDRPLAELGESQDEWMMIVFPRDRPNVIRHVQTGFDPVEQPPLIFEEVVQDSFLGTMHRIGQFW
ncbi:uncharacterized protein FTOL_01652 [Fusarium torulosum]|uniref:Uncharacterized protein n=1 Tax=Fusarium torulosum TaxID=33205 RepID=A0AAE8SE17_9HYPO|nr:uncharacterized protein FTOL_01652 [Fusarium torulosum]